MIIELWFDPRDSWARILREDLRTALADPRLAGLAAEVLWRPAQPEAVASTNTNGGRRRLAGHDARRLLVLGGRVGGAEGSERVAVALLDAAQGGLDLDDRSVLADVAERSGLSGLSEAAGFLNGDGDGGDSSDSRDTGDREVAEVLAIGRALGATVSPALSVGDRVLAGVLAPAVIANFLVEAVGQQTAPEEARRLRWAETLLAGRDPLGALAVVEPLLAEHGGDRNLLRIVGRAYFHSAQLSRAREALEQLVAAEPDDAYARLMLGRTLQRLGVPEEAAVHLKMAQAMDPDAF